MSTITIPAAHVAALRSGICCALREAGDEACDILACRRREDEDSRLRFSAAFDRMERARTLLVHIGWAPPQEGEPVPVDVNLCDHRGALIGALRVQIEAERGLAESLPEPEREPVHARVGELAGLLADATAECDETDDRREWHLRREGSRWVSVNGTYPMGDEGEEVHCRRVR